MRPKFPNYSSRLDSSEVHPIAAGDQPRDIKFSNQKPYKYISLRLPDEEKHDFDIEVACRRTTQIALFRAYRKFYREAHPIEGLDDR